jgi:hypothetical protein
MLTEEPDGGCDMTLFEVTTVNYQALHHNIIIIIAVNLSLPQPKYVNILI